MNHTDSTSDRPPVLEVEGLEHHLYDPGRGEEFVVSVRQRISIPARSLVAILGPSGCGKTTLLTVLGLLRRPTHPSLLSRFSIWSETQPGVFEEHDLKQLWMKRKVSRIEALRRRRIGFALQSGELLPALTLRENIAAPLRLNGVSGRKCWQRVDELVDAFGLRRHLETTQANASQTKAANTRLAYSRVNKLSGGEYQRAALARAIAHRPTLVFVDEPTAALNRELARGALEQLRALQTQESAHGATIMITHDEQLAEEFATVVIRMEPLRTRAAGEVVEVIHRRPRETPEPEAPAADAVVQPDGPDDAAAETLLPAGIEEDRS